MPMHSIILFDLDGTLIDTSPGIFSTANGTLRKLGFKELSDTQLRKFVGPPLAACFRVACGLEEQIISHACDVYREIYTQTGALFDAETYQNVPELLSNLVARGFTLGVATLKYDSLAVEVLTHFSLQEYFSVVSGADLDGKLTKADIIRNALTTLKCTDYQRVLMVGDTPHDLDGALEVGVDFVGVDWGFGFSKGHSISGQKGVLGMIDTPLSLLDYID